MQTMAAVMQQLGADASRLQVLFVSVDPKRDTPELLKAYVPQFHPSFIGLTGSEADIAAAAKGMRVFYQKVDGQTPTSYTYDHTAGSYVFDTKGQLRLLIKHGQLPADITPDIQKLLKAS